MPKRTIEEKEVTAEEFAEQCEEMIELVARRKCTFIITKEGKPFAILQPAPRTLAKANRLANKLDSDS